MSLDFSVVVPLFNEEGNVERLLASLTRSLDGNRLVADYEVICVDDGSTDATADLLRELETERTRIVTLPRNSGLSAAIAAGHAAARFGIIGRIDGDLQTSPDDFEILLQALGEGCDCAHGVRLQRRDSTVKRMTSAAANFIRRTVLGDDFEDISCPLAVFRAECVRDLQVFDAFHRYLPYLIQLQGYRVRQIPVSHFPRLAGRAKYGLFNRIWPGVTSLWRMRKVTRDLRRAGG